MSEPGERISPAHEGRPMSGGLAGKVARLRATFIAQLPERLDQARQLLAALPGAAGGDGAVRLRLLLHNLRGAAATFGLAELQASARAAEDLLTGRPAAEGAVVDAIAGHVATMARIAAALALAPAAVPPPEAGRDEAGAARGGGKRIHLCDDDPLVAEHLRAHLAEFGYAVEVFAAPAALRRAVAADPPDALIMDAVFTDGASAGFDAVDDIRRSLRPLPTVFLSSRDDFAARLRAVQAGGSAYFTKPVRVLDLVERLDALTATRPPAPLRILVVDDEPAVAAVHAAILEEAGMLTRIVTEPPSVLAALAGFPADLVLMDVYMPGCSGQELARVIRQIPEHLSLPIVFLSGETDAERQESALRVGGDGFLTKPIDPGQLVSAVGLRAERMRALRSLMVDLRRARDRAEDALVRLQQAQQALLQAEKLASLGALVHGIAHEINTPIGIALSCASHLADATGRLRLQFDADDIAVDDFQRYLDAATDSSGLILANCGRAAALVQDFKRVAVDHAGLQRRRFDLATIVAETLAGLAPRIGSAGHRLAIDCPAGLEVDGFPGAIAQVLANFVTNSLVHAFAPGRAGTLSVTVDRPAAGLVRLVYRDDGSGIPEQHRSRIFDPFFTTRRGAGGSGLGLHIVYNLVTGPLQGEVSVASAAGDGTAFTVVFPQVADDGDAVTPTG